MEYEQLTREEEEKYLARTWEEVVEKYPDSFKLAFGAYSNQIVYSAAKKKANSSGEAQLVGDWPLPPVRVIPDESYETN